MTSRLLLLNGSLRGSDGNTARLLQRASDALPRTWQADILCLADYRGTVEALVERLSRADAFLIGSGVYWGSWGSPLQRFLEVISSYELSACFLGKPAGALISADSVGGLDVAQRLLGAFSLLGCFLPPLSCVVLSRAACAASAADPEANADVWQLEDLRGRRAKPGARAGFYQSCLGDLARAQARTRRRRVSDVMARSAQAWKASADGSAIERARKMQRPAQIQHDRDRQSERCQRCERRRTRTPAAAAADRAPARDALNSLSSATAGNLRKRANSSSTSVIRSP